MIAEYRPRQIEQKAQNYWDNNQTFSTACKTSGPRENNYYCLSMFPYTSGNIHMGHVRNYTIGDVKTRIKKMQGFNVLQPMGWDSFGLPAENAAIKSKSHPYQWTQTNIASMKRELKNLGFAYDWSKELATCDSDYYRWQQWLFIKMFENNLVYRKESIVNWDPVDQTVLANEQVINGRGWRSNALVEQKKIPQWFCRITDYADRLSDDIEKLDKWPEAVKIMQKNWIGKSKGATVKFKIKNSEEILEVFTTRPDTLFGATYMAIAADHPIAHAEGRKDKDIKEFINRCKKQSTAEADIATAEKMGILTSVIAINPVNSEEIPVWIANYILMGYGTGAVMAVPAEDERDLEFAQKYDLGIKPVFDDNKENPKLINAGKFTGLNSSAAKKAITNSLVEMRAGKKETTYRLRDWGVSRQRYWGVPIPIIYCPSCGAVPEKEENLPVKLPTDIDYQYGEPLLKNCESFYRTTCPQCGSEACRETDTFDTFFDSSWYYHYFISQGSDGITSKKNDQWLGVDLYIGGIEHAILHLLYARFIQKVLVDLSLTDIDEPFYQLLSQGMVLKDGAKMSKSKGNVVSPDELIKKFGADTIRLFIIFAAPPTQDLDWSDGGVEGCFRFLKRVWAFVQENLSLLTSCQDQLDPRTLEGEEKKAFIESHKELMIINRDIENIQLNTVASGAMKLFQKISKVEASAKNAAVLRSLLSSLLRVLNPITPHITQCLWQDCKFGEDIATAAWPKADKTAIALEDKAKIVVQINGKKKALIEIKMNSSQEEVMHAVENCPQARMHVEKNQPVKKTIYVKNKLINYVS